MLTDIYTVVHRIVQLYVYARRTITNTLIYKTTSWLIILCDVSSVSLAHLNWFALSFSLPTSQLRGGLGAGDESKAERMDWYSSQTWGMLPEPHFKHLRERRSGSQDAAPY